MKESRVIKILIISCIFFSLVGGFLVLQKGWIGGSASLSEAIKNQSQKVSALKLVPRLAGFGVEKKYLLLFQNNLEIRPAGGYLGSFGIITVKNGKPVSFEVHDTNIFDGFSKVFSEPPYPIKTFLGIDNWQMRDSNWSADFPSSARQVEYFYHLQGGAEKFDGIIGINASILEELLKLTGPIYLADFRKEFKYQDVLYQLEYEVEKGYVDRGIDPGERKTILKSLIHRVLDQVAKKDLWQEPEFRELLTDQLNNKNIQIYLHDESDQKDITEIGWAGAINQDYEDNYLMTVESNFRGLKSNTYVKREIDYFVDFSKNRPEAKLKITFRHSERKKDWFSDDYRSYLRVYVPLGSYLTKSSGVEDATGFYDELNKTSFGNFIIVPAGGEKVVEYSFLLPESYKDKYNILVQKQSGIDQIPVKYTIINHQGQTFKLQDIIKNDWEGIVYY